MRLISILIFISLSSIGCTKLIKINDNKVEGFANKKVKFRDYSSLGNEYLPLANMEIKADQLHFCCIQKDTVLGIPLIMSAFDIKVHLKLITKWNITGTSAKKPLNKRADFQVKVSQQNALKHYHQVLNQIKEKSKGQYQKNNLGIFKVEGLLFPFHQTEKSFLVFTPNFTFKLEVSKNIIDADTELWLVNYLTYDLSRGIRFKIDNVIYELDSENILSLSELSNLQ